MMARVSGIYDEPELYQLACAYRDVTAEASAVLSWCDKHYQTHPLAQTSRPAGLRQQVNSVLELAAGPAEHARELARRGLRATALDWSPAMCAYAAAQAEAAGLDLDVVEADMRDFNIPNHFDLAITMLNSLCHLFTLDDLLAHLTAVAAHLVRGGLYVVELAHPADYLDPVPRTSSEWIVEQGGVRAEVRWGGPEDRIDPVSQITREHMSITARAADGTVRAVSDVVPNRFWTATEMTAAVRLAGGLEVAASYGDFDDTTTLDDPAAWRMILILRRE
jgi:SAM-dependent methyltransferase